MIWYDSVTKDGTLSWQNTLNHLNRDYFEDSDGIFLNYGWTDTSFEVANETVAARYVDRRKDVYFGIDVFGRGQLGGLETATTLARIVAQDYSIAIFAPGWTYESVVHKVQHLNAVFLQRNDQFYASLWQHLYTSGPSALPFYSSFCLGSGQKRFSNGRLTSTDSWFNLCNQQPQLSVPMRPNFLRHCFQDAFEGGSCVEILGASLSLPLRLFCTEFACENDLIIAYTMKRSSDHVDLELLLSVRQPETDARCRIVCGSEQFVRRDPTAWPGHYAFRALRPPQTEEMLRFLGQTNEKFIPYHIEGCDWEIRY